MATSAKFLVLALTALSAGKFEEAGCLFAQAGESDDVAQVTNALMELIGTDDNPGAEVPIGDQQQLASGGSDDDSDASDSESDGSDASDDEAPSVAVSSGNRRTSTSLHRIGQILSASMEATAAEEATDGSDQGSASDEGSDFDENPDTNPGAVPEFDPDVPGETLIPASFSTVVKLKGIGTTPSPVRLKA